MALKKRESLLFQRLKQHTKNIHFTRIESSTVQGIPDVHGCGNGVSFWIELKSTEDSFPILSKFQMAWCYEYARHQGKVFILHQALSQGALKLYRVSSGVDPLVTDLVFSFPRSRSLTTRPRSSEGLEGSPGSVASGLVPRSRFLVLVCSVAVLHCPPRRELHPFWDSDASGLRCLVCS
jgi:hypothetical protein